MTAFVGAERRFWEVAPGLLAAVLIAMSAALISRTELAQWLGLSTLMLAILLGILIGNTLFFRMEDLCLKGLDFSKTFLLRLGIVLYGFRVSFQEVATIGGAGVVVSVIMVTLTFSLAMLVGTRLLKLDRETAILIGAGSAVCGAAAVMATAAALKGSAEKTSVAIATVVVFGTFSMLIYPLAYPYLGLSELAYGVFVGSTIHEVAQVVVAGSAVSQEAEAVAVVTKMLRVIMLAPFLVIVSWFLIPKGRTESEQSKVNIPWFALAFILIIAINSLDILPTGIVSGLIELDAVLLAVAMAALGLRTSAKAIGQAGMRPLGLGIMLLIFLGIGGYFINTAASMVL